MDSNDNTFKEQEEKNEKSALAKSNVAIFLGIVSILSTIFCLNEWIVCLDKVCTTGGAVGVVMTPAILAPIPVAILCDSMTMNANKTSPSFRKKISKRKAAALIMTSLPYITIIVTSILAPLFK